MAKRAGEQIAEAIALASLTPDTISEDTISEDIAETNSDDLDPPTKGGAARTNTLDDASDDTSPTPANRGQLIADATCAPADIRYPTDVSLLNEAREKTDAIIDKLHQPLVGKARRPRTYRVKARRAFVNFTKNKKPGRNKIRRANRRQLGFLARNLRAIDRLLENPAAAPLSRLQRRTYKNLLVCRELYRQQ